MWKDPSPWLISAPDLSTLGEQYCIHTKSQINLLCRSVVEVSVGSPRTHKLLATQTVYGLGSEFLDGLIGGLHCFDTMRLTPNSSLRDFNSAKTSERFQEDYEAGDLE
jgi:hypothetical protein